jgi:multiple sugar transport system ATP-binding protein
VSIARALARDLRVLLFDEPFANLDQQFRTEARLELKRLLHEFPVTTVYVTHDQHEAMALGDRIAVMREGRLEQAGTFSLLYNSPINLFVATFIGTPTINLFSGQVRHGQWYGENFGGYPIRSDLDDGTAVTMGIRPEYIELTPQPEDGTPAVVDSVTPYYSERYQLLEVHLGGEDWMLQLPLHPPIEKGTTIYCTLNPDGILYFDTRTGRRIG